MEEVELYNKIDPELLVDFLESVKDQDPEIIMAYLKYIISDEDTYNANPSEGFHKFLDAQT